MFWKKKNKDVTVQALLWCPDGLPESVGFDLPSQIDSFIKWVNTYTKDKGYSIELKKFSVIEELTKAREAERKR